MTVVARTAGDPLPPAAAVRKAVWRVNPDQPAFHARSTKEIVAENTCDLSALATLLSAFALITLVLAAVGLYGVMSYNVSRRTHEIGVRMAIGAQRSDVLRQVLKQGFLLAVVGLATGLLGSWALTRTLSSQLYEVSPADPVTFVTVSTLLLVVALLACYVPARRATRVDPMVALRCE